MCSFELTDDDILLDIAKQIDTKYILCPLCRVEGIGWGPLTSKDELSEISVNCEYCGLQVYLFIQQGHTL